MGRLPDPVLESVRVAGPSDDNQGMFYKLLGRAIRKAATAEKKEGREGKDEKD